jgi:uncharacterized protein
VIEVKKENMKVFMEKREKIVSNLRKIGFSFVTLDLEGLTSGKLNRTIEDVSK